jgi:hypothetical protein
MPELPPVITTTLSSNGLLMAFEDITPLRGNAPSA